MSNKNPYDITISVCHILSPYSEELTLCHLNVFGWWDSAACFFDTWCTLEESLANPEEYPEIERCDICWRDEEGRTLILLGVE